MPDCALLHWGLGLRHYTGFTSPIRKYVDLTVHRQVLGMLDAAKGAINSSAKPDSSSKKQSETDNVSPKDCDAEPVDYSATNSVEESISCARLLNSHEANFAAFKKSVANMFCILSGKRTVFAVSIEKLCRLRCF